MSRPGLTTPALSQSTNPFPSSMARAKKPSESVVIRTSRLRDKDKDLLIAIFKVKLTRRMNFVRVGTEMYCTMRAARERLFRLKKKIASNERPEFRDAEFSLMVSILHDLPDAAIDFDEVVNTTMVSGKALTGPEAREKYRRMRKRVYAKIDGTEWDDDVSLWFIDPYDSGKEY